MPSDEVDERDLRQRVRDQQACPRCEAPAGDPCRGEKGQARQANHVERLRLYRDELFEVLAEVCGIADWSSLTRDERGRLNAATVQLREVCATDQQVRERAAEWRQRYPGIAVTPQVLTRHWSSLSRASGIIRDQATSNAELWARVARGEE